MQSTSSATVTLSKSCQDSARAVAEVTRDGAEAEEPDLPMPATFGNGGITGGAGAPMGNRNLIREMLDMMMQHCAIKKVGAPSAARNGGQDQNDLTLHAGDYDQNKQEQNPIDVNPFANNDKMQLAAEDATGDATVSTDEADDLLADKVVFNNKAEKAVDAEDQSPMGDARDAGNFDPARAGAGDDYAGYESEPSGYENPSEPSGCRKKNRF